MRRKRDSCKDARTETIRVRLTAAERDQWRRAADREGHESLSEWLREAAMLAVARGSTR